MALKTGKWDSFFLSIKELSKVRELSKHEQIVRGVLNAIDEKILGKDDALPSVNVMIRELGFARETISKAYKDLVERGIIYSTNRLGYFIAVEDTRQFLKVALVMFNFDIIQETLYHSFKNVLGRNVHLDIFFHHNNINTLKSIISNIGGKYGMYVVAPIPHPQIKDILRPIPVSKFLMIDRFVKLDEEYSYIVQEFENAAYSAFVELKGRISEFKEIIFFHRPSSDEPAEIPNAFYRFLKDFNIKGSVYPEYIPGSVEEGKVYFTINNAELWIIIKDALSQNLKLGQDVGVLSHNDDTVKEIICGGITTFSADFSVMGKKAGEFVLNRQVVKEVLPTRLIRRASL
ncbi:GntR family transcriptional regulator [Agrobacterium tumefaciens]|nr:GntR family transcriptional regulator [Agrobacterium tumefaciens]NTE22917.1 GntR family transcriptional regulator [Agrobacterium tumefaciens]